MKILIYNELDTHKVPNFSKMSHYLEAGDFQSADVKKVGDNLYRAKLNKEDRLLFSIYRYQGEAYLLLLECILNHAYEKSRFLRGHATIDENKIPALSAPTDIEATTSLAYINPNHSTIHLLDKILSFDEAQHQIYQLQPPLIIIGSAGSGKTALTLEKMKQTTGDILYVSRSPYLVHNSRNLYYAFNYDNENQTLDFLSFDDYLASIHVSATKEMPFREFESWFTRHRTGKLKDANQLFEEFKGVLTGQQTEEAYLSRQAYLDLGIKQSIFSVEERPLVYDLFEKYLDTMRDKGYHDSNIISHAYLAKVKPTYDFIIVDEVQDLTNVQLQVILKALNKPTNFILCGDSNQIVHPNFFSWAKIKTLFYEQKVEGGPTELIRVLNTNYRNSPQVTQAANNILKIKNSRFGSIDRESNYLVQTNVETDGKIALIADDKRLLQQLDKKSRLSTRFAVIVMHPEQKAQAKQYFKTPLVFAVQEAKGLEYDNIILYHFVSNDESRFQEICRNVTSEDLKREELTYARGKDKTDKSLEIFKFYINALYVAVTRAICNLYWVETNPKHRLFNLLNLQAVTGDLDELPGQDSTLDEWRKEAHKLEMQGKQEQAEEIRHQILKQEAVPWEVYQGKTLETLKHNAIKEGNKKAKLALFEYALVYNEPKLLNQLDQVGFKPAKNPQNGLKPLNQKYYAFYEVKHTTGIMRQVEKYGVDFRNPFNQTPLMIASRFGRTDLVELLIEEGAKPELVNNSGINAFQMALEQAMVSPQFMQNKLVHIYPRLEPDNVAIQVNERLISLDNHLMEFLMLNLVIIMTMIALNTHKKTQSSVEKYAFTSGDFLKILEQFPQPILPDRRKKRPYVSSILSKNEINRDDKYNRQLFLRVKRGYYVINPNLSVRLEDEWHNIYDLLNIRKPVLQKL
jgi:hypothetical protein